MYGVVSALGAGYVREQKTKLLEIQAVALYQLAKAGRVLLSRQAVSADRGQRLPLAVATYLIEPGNNTICTRLTGCRQGGGAQAHSKLREYVKEPNGLSHSA